MEDARNIPDGSCIMMGEDMESLGIFVVGIARREEFVLTQA